MNEVKLSRYLSYLLRHNPDDANLNMDKNGWVLVDELIKNTSNKFTKDNLEHIVLNDKKTRYSFNDDKTKIRANQGHSINVDVELEEAIPPDILYHGTADRFIISIMKEGIKSQTRKHVHLSKDKETALEVGLRHGNAVILQINTKEMIKDGIKFYLSKNGVWLTNYIESKYIVREPYFKIIKKSEVSKYNPWYGDDKVCVCGHPYHRHFDSYENMYPCGCKYCNCNSFKLKE